MYEYKKLPIMFNESAFESLQGNGGFAEVLWSVNSEIIPNPTEKDWDNGNNTLESVYGFFIHKDYLLNPTGQVEMLTSEGQSNCWDGSWVSVAWSYIKECFWISKEDYLALGGTFPEHYEHFIELHGQDPHAKVLKWYEDEQKEHGVKEMRAFLPIETRDEMIGDKECTIITGGLIPTEARVWFSGETGHTSHYPAKPTVMITEDGEVIINWNDDFNHEGVHKYYYDKDSSLIMEPSAKHVLEHYEPAIIEFVQAYMEDN